MLWIIKKVRKLGNVKILYNISKTKCFYILRELCPIYNNVPQSGIMVLSPLLHLYGSVLWIDITSSLLKVFSVLPVQGRRVMWMYVPLALVLSLFCSIWVLSFCAYFLSHGGFGLHLTTPASEILVHKPSLYSQRGLSAWS